MIRTLKFEAVKNAPFKVRLPKRSTKNSAGYDFFSPYPFSIGSGETVVVKTWVKAKMPHDVCLILLERSSWGIRKGITIPNSVGLIDSDYYGNKDNDGNIMFAFTNHGKEPLEVKAGERIGQGVFLPYLITDDDISGGERTGGIGSTDKEETC